VPPLMKDVQIGDHMRSTTQRFVYAYDYLHMWMFMVELTGAHDPIKGKRYPTVVMSVGKPPAENSRMDAALMPSDDDMMEEAQEVYEDEDDHDDHDNEDHNEHGHGHDEGLSGHEQLPEDYH
jgi:hypothetical protein